MPDWLIGLAFVIAVVLFLAVSRKPAKVPCLECSGTGWFSPTPFHADGWTCYCCLGTGKVSIDGKQ